MRRELHEKPMRAETPYGFEPYPEHLSDYDWELWARMRPRLTDAELTKLGSWRRSAHQRLVVKDEQRQYRALNLAGDWQSTTVGLPRHEPRELGEPVSPRVMPTAAEYRPRVEREDGTEHIRVHRMRLSCTKWANPSRRTRAGGARRGRQQADPAALAELEARLGVRLDG